MEVKRAQIPGDGRNALVEKSGWLNKEGSIVKSWKKRFFKLQDQAIIYYESVKESSIKGVFLLRESECRVSKKKDKPFIFEIVHPRRTLYCSADSERELNEWVAAISNNISYQINVERGYTTQIDKLKSELELKAKETAEANRSMEDMRVKMQLDAIKTPAETKAASDALLEKQAAELRVSNESLADEVKSLNARLVAAENAATTATVAAAAIAPVVTITAATMTPAELELMRSLQEELSTMRVQLARVKKERQILKAEVKRLVGVNDPSAAAAAAAASPTAAE